MEVQVVRNGETATVLLSGEFDLATLREAEAGFERLGGTALAGSSSTCAR